MQPSSGPPPMGLVTRARWLELRIQAIDEAIARYEAVRLQIPVEWLNEYRHRQRELQGVQKNG